MVRMVKRYGHLIQSGPRSRNFLSLGSIRALYLSTSSVGRYGRADYIFFRVTWPEYDTEISPVERHEWKAFRIIMCNSGCMMLKNLCFGFLLLIPMVVHFDKLKSKT
jgi:hypothetical protein